jgi:DNA invertase Pin-like site-specific DNA recombinase
LDRLGRSLRELIETVDQLKGNGIGMMSLEEKWIRRQRQGS